MKTLKIILISLLFNSTGYSQDEIPKMFKLNTVNFSFSQLIDGFQNEGVDFMKALSTKPDIFKYDFQGYYPPAYTSHSGNVFQLDATFSRLNPTSLEYRLNRELRLGVFYSNRTAEIYTKREYYYRPTTVRKEYIEYEHLYHELNLNGAIVFKTGGNKKRIFRIYGGVGAGLGVSTSGHSHAHKWIDETDIDSAGNEIDYRYDVFKEYIKVKSKSVVVLRAQIPVGLELNLKKIRIGIETSAGTGLMQIQGGQVYMMRFNFGVGVRLGYLF